MDLNKPVGQLGAMAMILSLTCCGEAIAEVVTIAFEATISESPMPDGPLAVGMPLTGSYNYDAPPPVIDSGVNYARYRLLDLTLSTGVNQWRSKNVQLSIAHDIGIQLPNSVIYEHSDVYNPTGYSPIAGPPVGSFRPAVIDLFLIDTDASVYANGLDYDLPPIEEFEAMLLTVRSLPAWITVVADLDSVFVVPEPSVWAFMVPTALLLACFGRGLLGLLGSGLDL